MLMPDCRKDDTYNEDFLNEKDKEFLRGFDWAVEMAVDMFFQGDMGGLKDEDLYLGHVLCEKIPDEIRKEYTMDFTFGDKESEDRTTEDYGDMIQLELFSAIESERNGLIVSMIDNMDKRVYEAIRESALEKNKGKYHDTRSFK